MTDDAGEGASPVNLMSPEVMENPYPFYKLLRDQMPAFYIEQQDIWIVSRYADVLAVLRDPETFGQWDGSELVKSNPEMAEAREMMERTSADEGFRQVDTLVTCDPPAHSRYRSLMAHAWSAKRTSEDMEPRIEEIANELIDSFIERGSFDLVREYAYPLPIIVIAEILGVPISLLDTFKRWSDDFVAPLGGNLSKERMVECSKSILEFNRYFAEQLADRRSNPRDDVLTVMIQAQIDGERPLEDNEALSILAQLLVAGNETTTNAFGHTLWLILSTEGLLDRLIADDSLVDNIVEEALRVESPVQGLFRQVRVDTEIAGVAIPKGSSLLTLFASANRDDAQFPDAAQFDPERENARRHLAFGQGIHRCLGEPLARKELQLGTRLLLRRLSGLRLAPGHEPRHQPHPLLRGFGALHLEFEPGVTTPTSKTGA